MADLKNIIIDDDVYAGVKKISVRDTVSGRDLFLSEGFIEDSTQIQDITVNGQQMLVPSTGFDATKKIVVNVNVPSSVGGDATAGDIRKGKTAWVNGVEITGTLTGEEKSVTITNNGTMEIIPSKSDALLSKVTVITKFPQEVSTAQEMDSLLVEANAGQYYKYTGASDFTEYYINGDIYMVEK